MMAAIANRRPGRGEIFRRLDWVAAVAVSLLVVGFHIFFLLHAGGFWRDEVNLINLSAGHSLSQMARDAFPVLMPVLVRGWTALGLGRSDLSLRILGTLIGLAIPAALWFAVWKIRRRPPLLGLVLLALNTTVIIFGDSLRAYGVGSLTILLTVAAAALFLQQPTWPRTAALAALAILSVQALYQNAVLIAAICFGAWAVCARRKDGRAALKILFVSVISAASLLPYWSNILSMPNAAASLRSGFNPDYVFDNFDNAAGSPLEQYTWVWGFLALTVIAGGGVSLFARRRTAASTASNGASDVPSVFPATIVLMAVATVAGFFWFAAAPAAHWWFFPLLAAGIAWCDRRFTNGPSHGNRLVNQESETVNDLPLFAGVALLTAGAAFAAFLWFAALTTEPWYFLPLLSLAAVCFEIGLPLSGCHTRAAVSGFAVSTLIGSVCFARGDLTQRFTDVDLIARRLTTEAAPDDYIVVSPWYCGITFDHYFKGPAPWDTLPPLADHTLHRYDLVRQEMETPHALKPVLDKIAVTLQTGHLVWLVGSMSLPKPGAPIPVQPPPPPLKYSGWCDRPYNSIWAAQAAQFLSNHSRRFELVYYPTNLYVNFAENMQLRVAAGWRDAATPSTPAAAGVR